MKITGRIATACCFVYAGSVIAADVTVDITVGTEATKSYILESLQVAPTGAMSLVVKSSAPVDQSTQTTHNISYAVSPAAGAGSVLMNGVAAPTTFTCTGGACSPSSLLLTASPNIAGGYQFKNWGTSGACASQGSTPTCQVTLTANAVSVAAVFESTTPTPNPGVACNPAGTTIVDVQTQLPTAAFPKTTYANVALPETIYSFAFKSTASVDPQVGALTEAQLTNTLGNKRVVVSECRGDVSTVGKDKGCYNFGSEGSIVTYLVNRSNYRPDRYCNLKPNTQYYANVVSPGPVTTGEAVTCTSPTNCGFSFNAQ